MATEPPVRSWRLHGYAGKDLVHDRIYPTDRELDQAIARLENNPDITRITAKPL